MLQSLFNLDQQEINNFVLLISPVINKDKNGQ